MTVRAEIPYVEYTGNGVTVDFSFDWSSGDPNDNYVLFNNVLQIEGTIYELEEYTPENGGVMRFNEPPTDQDTIVIYRKTPITQEVDYEEGKPFPAETHERQMDKDTRILQEILETGRSIGGIVNLSADQQPEWVDIVNSSGTDARVTPWTTDGGTSGVALGEVVDGGTTPVDGASTDKHDGYIWWVLGAAPALGGDPNILMQTGGITVYSARTTPEVPRAEFAYIASTGNVGWGYDQTLPLELPEWQEEAAIVPPVAADTYLIKLDKTSGDDPSGSVLGTWLDADSDAAWYLTSGLFDGVFHVAPDSGGGVPDETKKISRGIVLQAVQN